jgi:hypothetical protein
VICILRRGETFFDDFHPALLASSENGRDQTYYLVCFLDTIIAADRAFHSRSSAFRRDIF